MYHWIKKEVSAGFQIEMRVLEECADSSTADEREAFWIDTLRDAGNVLYNKTSGNVRRAAGYRAKALAYGRERLKRDCESVAQHTARKP